MDGTDFIYQRLRTMAGVKLEIVSGGSGRKGRVWELLARQVYAENGRDDYRTIVHTPCGAPLLEGEQARISVSHTPGFLAIATLPPTPEVDLEQFSLRAALGIDVESLAREQVLRVRDKFLSEEEKGLIPTSDIEANVIAWTCKEAAYKLLLSPGLNYRTAITLHKLPQPDGQPGTATAVRTDGLQIDIILYAMAYEGKVITLAITPTTATYAKTRR